MRQLEYSGDYLVIGPPGTGKTTWLSRQLEKLIEQTGNIAGIRLASDRPPALVCSLTRTAAAEIAKKAEEMGVDVPRSCIGTLHSHAYRAIGTPPLVAGDLLKLFNKENPGFSISADGYDVDEPEWGSEETIIGEADDLHEQYHLLRARMIDRRLWSAEVQRFAQAFEGFKAAHGAIDFSDMIELALNSIDKAPGDPYAIIADEAQDMAAMEFALLRKWGKAAGVSMIVGDPWQSLYTWRGANPAALLDSAVPDTHRKVLHQSYRVPAAVHRRAIKWVSQLSDYAPIEYQPRKVGDVTVEGEVSMNDGTSAEPSPLVDAVERDLAAGKSAMICGACSYMLSKTLAELKARGIPFCNRWRTKRGDWNPLGSFDPNAKNVSMARRIVSLLRCDYNTWTDQAGMWTYKQLYEWTAALKGVLRRGVKGAIEFNAKIAPDTPASSLNLAEWFEEDVFEMLSNWLDEFANPSAPPIAEILDWYGANLVASKTAPAQYPLKVAAERGGETLREAPRVYIGTIHSFKGAEAEHVYVFPDISPAGMREWMDGGVHRDSIVRTFYVAMTRASEKLILCEPCNNRSIDWE